MTSEKLMIFIDSQNLIYACESFARKKDPSQKFYSLPEKIIPTLVNMKPNRKLIQVRFYTAIAEIDKQRGKADVKRYEGQRSFNAFLETQMKWYVFSKIVRAYPVFCPYCKSLGTQTQITCPTCGKNVIIPKNKGVDIALATDLLVYGLPENPEYGYDVAILVSGDTDFIPAIKKIKDRKPAVKIEVAQFSNAVGYKLKSAVDDFYQLDSIADQIGEFRPRKVALH
jgi:uncharacterized LabA/DUF88 family protein